ncbi:MAG: sulfurtransferase [Chitinispirillaceae bacterium]
MFNEKELNSAVTIADPQWLEQNLDSDDLQIMDCQPDVYDYFHGHIPGAVYFSDKLWRCWEDSLPTRYTSAEIIEPMLRRSGLDRNKKTAVYSGKGSFSHQGDGLEGTMCAYSLARWGFSRIYYIDGGLDRCKEEKKPVTKTFPQVEKTEVEVELQNELFVTFQQFLELKEQDNCFVVDIRPPEAYKEARLWSSPGHIPGATNIFWKLFMDHQNKYRFRTTEHIQELVQSRGATPDKTIILYCGTGREATNAFVTFKWVLQYPHVKLFEGSFTEWSARKQPTVVGKTPW